MYVCYEVHFSLLTVICCTYHDCLSDCRRQWSPAYDVGAVESAGRLWAKAEYQGMLMDLCISIFHLFNSGLWAQTPVTQLCFAVNLRWRRKASGQNYTVVAAPQNVWYYSWSWLSHQMASMKRRWPFYWRILFFSGSSCHCASAGVFEFTAEDDVICRWYGLINK